MRRRLFDYHDATVLHKARKSIKAASIVLCYTTGVQPTSDNLKRARNTLYQWARNQAVIYTDSPLSLLLYWNIQAAMLAGTKWFAFGYANRKQYATVIEHGLAPEALNHVARLYWEQKVEPWYGTTT